MAKNCNPNIIRCINVCEGYIYTPDFSADNGLIYVNDYLFYQGEIFEDAPILIESLNVGMNKITVRTATTCTVFYVETYYSIGTNTTPAIPCPTLCELIGESSGETIKDCLSPEQIEEICEVTPCEDATYTIEDTDTNVLYSGNIVSGGNLNQTINDSTAVLKDTANNVLSNTSILAQGSEDIVAPDSTYSVQDTAANVLDSGSILSGGSDTIVIADSSAVLKDTANNTISTTPILAEGTSNIVAPDATLTLNSGVWTSKKSNSVEDITLKYVNGTDVPTTALSANAIQIANLLKDITLRSDFAITNDKVTILSCPAFLAGTYTSKTDDGASGAITYEVNDIVTALPFTIVAGDKIEIIRATTTSAGWVETVGTY